jgi:ABC-type branched-subunit amino acid transport system ATPase component
MTALLEVSQLNAWYDASQVLHGVSLAINEGRSWRLQDAMVRGARRLPRL